MNYVLDQRSVKNTDPPLDIQKKLDDSNYGCTNMILDNKTLKNLDVIPHRDRDNDAASLFRCAFANFSYILHCAGEFFKTKSSKNQIVISNYCHIIQV